MTELNLSDWGTIVMLHHEILTKPSPIGGDPIVMTPGTGPGWYRLIHELCERLERTPAPWPVCTDIKVDRGGQLCFYVDGASELQHGLIEMAEDLSNEICPDCGSMKAPEVRCCTPGSYV